MSTGLFKVIVTFKNAKGGALFGEEFTVRLFDEDRYFDDKLGQAKLDENGRADFLISITDILSIDSPAERTPDLYFVVEQNGTEIFRSDTIANVNFETENPVTGRSDNLTKSFGPFQVEIQ